jgi:uncharacterized RDD family membrane protein YckC
MTYVPPHSSCPAGLFRRLAALAYDLLLILGIVMMTSFALVIVRGGVAVPAGTAGYQLLVLAQCLMFFVGFWVYGGQTPGMRSWNIRLEPVDGGRIGIRMALWRAAGALVSAAAGGLGFLSGLFDPQGRTWHDRLSRTRVVRVSGNQGR